MRRRGLYILVGPLVAAACRREPVVLQRVSHPPDIELKPETLTIEARVPHPRTLEGVRRAGALGEPFVVAAIEAARSVFNPRQLHSDRPYRLVRSLDGML